MPTSHADEQPTRATGHRDGERQERPRTASRAGHIAPPAAASAWLAGLRLPLPRLQDQVVFLRGLPVAPWMTTRPWQIVWSAWLARLEVLFAEWEGRAAGSGANVEAVISPASVGEEQAVTPLESGWEVWRETHVHSMEARRVEQGIAALRQILADLPSLVPTPSREATPQAHPTEPGGVHLVGHSVGGAVILAYLAHLREHPQERPLVPLRSAMTLDAAVSGLAGAWSGAKSYLHWLTGNRIMAEGLLGLNQWATEQEIRVLTVSNSGDMWSHNRVADLPYLGVHLGSRLALADQFNGTIHDWLRRTPEFVEAIWSLPSDENIGC